MAGTDAARQIAKQIAEQAKLTKKLSRHPQAAYSTVTVQDESGDTVEVALTDAVSSGVQAITLATNTDADLQTALEEHDQAQTDLDEQLSQAQEDIAASAERLDQAETDIAAGLTGLEDANTRLGQAETQIGEAFEQITVVQETADQAAAAAAGKSTVVYEEPQAAVVTRTNHNINPDGTVSTTGWTGLGTRAATPAGLQVDLAASTTGAVLYNTTTIAATPGQAWSDSFQVTVPVGFPSVTIRAQVNSYGTATVQNAGATVTIQPGETATIVAAVAELPASATGVRAAIYGSGTGVPAGARMIVTRMLLVDQATPGDPFDGDTAAHGDYRYEWAGIAHQSVSYELKGGPDFSTILWIDTADGNTPKRWDGTSWVAVTDQTAVDAAAAAAEAKQNAQDAATQAATALSAASGAQTAAEAAQAAADAARAQVTNRLPDPDFRNNFTSWAGTGGYLDDTTIGSPASLWAGLDPASGSAVAESMSRQSGSATNAAAGSVWEAVARVTLYGAPQATLTVRTNATGTGAPDPVTVTITESGEYRARLRFSDVAGGVSMVLAAVTNGVDSAAVFTGLSLSDVTALAAAEDAAAAAQSTADNLPKILHSTSAPGTTTAPDGSVWFRHDGALSGAVIGQWNRVAGTWAATPFTSDVIANLDVGKLTAGAAEIIEVVAQKIAASTAAFQTVDVVNLFATGTADINAAVIQKLAAQQAAIIQADIKNLFVSDGATMNEAVIQKLWADVFVAKIVDAEKVITSEAIVDELIGKILTGGLIQTNTGETTGVKLGDAGLIAYNAAGMPTVQIDAETGELVATGGTFSGDIIGADITGSTITGSGFYTGTPWGAGEITIEKGSNPAGDSAFPANAALIGQSSDTQIPYILSTGPSVSGARPATTMIANGIFSAGTWGSGTVSGYEGTLLYPSGTKADASVTLASGVLYMSADPTNNTAEYPYRVRYAINGVRFTKRPTSGSGADVAYTEVTPEGIFGGTAEAGLNVANADGKVTIQGATGVNIQGTPFLREAAGYQSAPSIAAGSNADVTVTLPTGRFTDTPAAFAFPASSVPAQRAMGITSRSTSAIVFRQYNGTSSTGGAAFAWMAKEIG